jgi:hypothetical protein
MTLSLLAATVAVFVQTGHAAWLNVKKQRVDSIDPFVGAAREPPYIL